VGFTGIDCDPGCLAKERERPGRKGEADCEGRGDSRREPVGRVNRHSFSFFADKNHFEGVVGVALIYSGRVQTLILRMNHNNLKPYSHKSL
jgi:hypothetical protein